VFIAFLVSFSLSGCSGRDSSAELGSAAGDWLVNGDIFYDPSGSAASIDALCESNYQADSNRVGNKALYIETCKNAFFKAQKETDNNYVEPAPVQPTSDPKDQMPPYWKPTVENMILCASDHYSCEGWNHQVSYENTFGVNASKIAQKLVDLGLCSDIDRYDEASDENSSQCYIGDQGNRLRVITNDHDIQLLLAYNLGYETKMVLKDGLIVIVSTTDRPDLIDQIGPAIGGQVVSIG
jgi:hypothetical protein